MSYASQLLTHTLAGYWKVDESSGTSATDSSGNSRTGAYTTGTTLGATSLIPTGEGTCFRADGSHRLSVAHNAAFNAPTAGTLTITRFDDKGIAGSFSLQAEDRMQPRTVKIEGTFDMPCRGGMVEGGCRANKAIRDE